MTEIKIWSVDGETPKGKSNMTFYMLAVFIGFVIFAIFLGLFKVISLALKLLINYWMFVLGGIVAILLLKKALSKKQLVVKREAVEQ